ncbi:hypothetical protein T261_7543 [Streptomyces lydicus]|nr:hypothetical protein T261_7543 [Streptomyces lydicus]
MMASIRASLAACTVPDLRIVICAPDVLAVRSVALPQR